MVATVIVQHRARSVHPAALPEHSNKNMSGLLATTKWSGSTLVSYNPVLGPREVSNLVKRQRGGPWPPHGRCRNPVAASAAPGYRTPDMLGNQEADKVDQQRREEGKVQQQQVPVRQGPLVMAYDHTADAQEALDWAAQNLVFPGDNLEIVHVVCDPQSLHTVTSVGMSPTGRSMDVDSMDLGEVSNTKQIQGHADYLRRQAEQAIKPVTDRLRATNLSHRLNLPCLNGPRAASSIADIVVKSADQLGARMLLVASHGPGALAEYGSVARYTYQHSTVPLVLIPPKASSAPLTGDIILVVSNLEDLDHHWQWVADNLVRRGDRVHIWHIAGPSASGMPSLPTVIEQHMRERGIADVHYHSLYSTSGDTTDVAQQVCRMAEAVNVKLVTVMNYSRGGLIQEALFGSVASHLSRQCPKPLVLLQPPE